MFDLNDPRHRLQAAQNASPSLRSSASPVSLTLADNPQPSNPNISLAPDNSAPGENFQGHTPDDPWSSLGKSIVSGVQQGIGDVADVAVQGGGLLNYMGDQYNPFISEQQRQKQIQQDMQNSEGLRAAIHGVKDVGGNNIVGTSGADQAAGNIAAGRGSVQDYATVAGQGLQTGLDATQFFNPTRLGAEAFAENLGTKQIVKDVLGSSAVLGGTQGVATGTQTYGQTGDLGQAAAAGAQSGLAGFGLQSVLGGLGHLAGTLLSKTSGAATQIARSNSRDNIFNILDKQFPGLDPTLKSTLAEGLTSVKDKKSVKAILDEVSRTNEEIPVEKAVERGVEKPTQQDNSPEPTPTQPDQPNAPQAPQEGQTPQDIAAQTDKLGLDPNNPNDTVPAFQRSDKAEETRQTLQQVLDKSPEVVNSAIFNMKQQLAKDIKEHPELEPQLRAKYNENVKTLQGDIANRDKLQSDIQRLTPQEVPADTTTASVPDNAAPKEGEAGPAGKADANTPEGIKPQSGAEAPKFDENGNPINDRTFTADENGNVKVDTAGQKTDIPPDVQNSVKNAPPDVQQAIKDLFDNLAPASQAIKETAKLRKAQKSARITSAEAANQAAGGGEAGYLAQRSALGGEYAKTQFNPVDVHPDIQDAILKHVQSSDLSKFDKFNLQSALRKLWGADPNPPVKSDIKYIKQFFGDDVANKVEEAINTTPQGKSWQDTLAQITGVPRAIMASADLSGIGRQGLALGLTDPKAFGRSIKDSVKYFANEDNYNAAMKDIETHPYRNFISDMMKVDLTGLAGKEEQYAGSSLAEKAPTVLGGGIIRGSDRAYSGMLTALRFNAASKAIDAAGGLDNFIKLYEDQFGDKAQDAFRAYGEVINTLSGRGGKSGGALDRHMGTLSATLFAPRLWVSNLQKLNPLWYARLARTNPAAARLAIRGVSSQLAAAGSIMALAAAGGATVGFDPRSSDFGKIKVGNTRYDVLGGMAQNIVLAAREITGQKVNSQTGQVQDLGKGFVGDRLNLLETAFENKENPLLAFASQLLQTKDDGNGNLVDQYGQPFDILQKAAGLVQPLGLQDVEGLIGDTGNIPQSIAMALPGFIGAGVQTYGNTPTKDQNSSAVASDGGIASKVTADKTADSAAKAQYKGTLSKDDQALVGLNATDLQSYVDNGTITQDHMDQILNEQKTLSSVSKDNQQGVPNGVKKDDLAKQVYEKYNSMDAKDQKYWLSDKNPPEDFAKKITDQVNAQRSPGLDPFKPSNALAKLYADYVKNINDNQNLTELDKRNAAKKFQTDAAKLNFGPNVQDLYTEGGSNDTETLIANGKIKQDDLNNAIGLDNQLYNSGLESSLKFSKKFRNTYGFTTPTNGPASSGRGGGGSSTNAHLSNFLPPSSGNGPTASGLPRFSAKDRNVSMSKGPATGPLPTIAKIRQTDYAVPRTPQRAKINL